MTELGNTWRLLAARFWSFVFRALHVWLQCLDSHCAESERFLEQNTPCLVHVAWYWFQPWRKTFVGQPLLIKFTLSHVVQSKRLCLKLLCESHWVEPQRESAWETRLQPHHRFVSSTIVLLCVCIARCCHESKSVNYLWKINSLNVTKYFLFQTNMNLTNVFKFFRLLKILTF